MKQLMITVKPEYLVNILNGYKTLELRTYILKNFDKIVKEQGGIWVNVYCSKSKPYLDQDIGRYFLVRGLDYIGYPVLNGKVVCRFWFDEYSFMEYFNKLNLPTTTPKNASKCSLPYNINWITTADNIMKIVGNKDIGNALINDFILLPPA